MKQKIKDTLKGKSWLYFVPRVIIIAYPILMVGESYVYSIFYGISLDGLVISTIAAVISASIVYMCLKLPYLGGLTLSVLGIAIMVGAGLSDQGFDLVAFIFGGVPLFVSGLLFIREALIKQKEGLQYLNKLINKKKP